ncbi:succinyl-diaminopimelate desuccinylase [Corynebacterium choanae]|uniref:succinyl-diaminopimelate desuccinylase n=1 Tax=Corynebacterium choanae TaxID=1862358 RepID=UPI000F4F554A|nr:succinyl-diaminopimelate desuccinylase [Corynebacterium choanae]
MLDLFADPITLTRQLVDIASPSHEEQALCDALEEALTATIASGALQQPLTMERIANNLIVRTDLGFDQRVILAGHLDTVPVADNVPSAFITDDQGQQALFGCGTVDMKSGDAVFLHTLLQACRAGTLAVDVTLILYEAEEVAERFNGLKHLAETRPELLQGDVAILGEPTAATIEAGCQGSIRLKITAHGTRAHSARSWMGHNAMHDLAAVISRVARYTARNIVIDGCEYREGLNVTWCESGVATNTIPDQAWMFVNFRFAPDRSVEQALTHLLEVLELSPEQRVAPDAAPQLPDGTITYVIDDACAGALPGLDQSAAAELVAATGETPRAKYGWTDVSRFAALGIPAVNFGPGDPSFAHKRDEQCPLWMITRVSEVLHDYLTGNSVTNA